MALTWAQQGQNSCMLVHLQHVNMLRVLRQPRTSLELTRSNPGVPGSFKAVFKGASSRKATVKNSRGKIVPRGLCLFGLPNMDCAFLEVTVEGHVTCCAALAELVWGMKTGGSGRAQPPTPSLKQCPSSFMTAARAGLSSSGICPRLRPEEVAALRTSRGLCSHLWARVRP